MSEHLTARIVRTPDGRKRAVLREVHEQELSPPAAVSRLLLPVASDPGFGEHFTPDGRDPRLPSPGTVTQLSRQAARRIGRGKHPRCCRCHKPVESAAEAVFDDGQEAHRVCSLTRNEALEEAKREIEAADARERAKRFGLESPDGGELWTPPNMRRTETPKLDLSKGKLLGVPPS